MSPLSGFIRLCCSVIWSPVIRLDPPLPLLLKQSIGLPTDLVVSVNKN